MLLRPTYDRRPTPRYGYEYLFMSDADWRAILRR